jgi:hypothetical protein
VRDGPIRPLITPSGTMAGITNHKFHAFALAGGSASAGVLGDADLGGGITALILAATSSTSAELRSFSVRITPVACMASNARFSEPRIWLINSVANECATSDAGPPMVWGLASVTGILALLVGSCSFASTMLAHLLELLIVQLGVGTPGCSSDGTIAVTQPDDGDQIVVTSQLSNTSGLSALPGGGNTIGCVGTPGLGQIPGGI